MCRFEEHNDGYNWVLNFIDCHTKFLFLFPLFNKTGENVLNCLKKIFRHEGAPLIIQSDNGLEFNNKLVKDYLKVLNIVFKRGRPRHPQNQGQVERANQTITRWIARNKTHTPIKRWIDAHDEIIFAYNTSWHRATNRNPMMAFRRRIGINQPLIVTGEVIEPTYLSDEDELNLQSINQELSPIVLNDTIIDPEYVAAYTRRMVNDADVHYHRINFNPGDNVLLSRSFDNNQSNKKRRN